MEKHLKGLSKDFLHHAYVIYGPKTEVKETLAGFLEEEMDLELKNNSDFLVFDTDILTIDTVRSITDSAQRKAISTKKIYLIFCRNIILEAQNALLKILEEPIENTHFFFVTETKGFAIPTLLSRVIEIDVSKQDNNKKIVKEFIESDLEKKLDIAKNLAKEKDRKTAGELINGLLFDINTRFPEKTNIKKALMKASIYIAGPSSSIKTLLEHIAILINAEKI